MDLELTEPIYERQADEPTSWFSRFAIYRALEPASGRLHAAYVSYRAKVGKSPSGPSQGVEVPGAWKKQAEIWRWKERAEAYDKHRFEETEKQAAALRELEAQEIARVMSSGYALMHKRIEALGDMARTIEESMKDPETEKYNPKWIDARKIEQWRGCLDDIAKEIGARIKKNEIAGKDGGPITFITEWGGGVIEDDNNSGEATYGH